MYTFVFECKKENEEAAGTRSFGPKPEKSEKSGSGPYSVQTRDHGLTIYNWPLREKSRYSIIPCCLFLSINVPKIRSCRFVENRRIKVLYVDLSSTVFRF